ncbi:MAG: Holliday junction branch migration protein RuvA [Candidatus Beckwithbacteria bacterium]|nr:Holliday junction branch migration protein RuvA [Patescibacteria group bacterium]
MIGQLTGKPIAHTPNALVLDVRGVGYKVFVSPKLHQQALQLDKLTLFTHTHVRDDTLDLYGFMSLEDLKLFQLIINISGIGPKIAIALMDKGVENISSAISKADVDFFTAIPRLGKKNAQKIIIELKPKLGDLEDLDLLGESSETVEAIEALAGLGFNKNKASQALREITKPDDSIEDKIKKAIKYLGPKNV